MSIESREGAAGGAADQPSHLDDRTQWVRWRTRRLLSAGFPADLAGRLARTDRIDLHRMLSLVDRGCPPHLAARILAPLDEDNETGGQTT